MNPQEQHEYDEAIQHGHTLFLNDRPLDRQEVLDIANAVIKKNPALIVAGVSRQMRRTVSEGHYAVYRGVDFAFSDAPTEVVGTVGYEYEQFFVTSRLIENAKFSRWSGREFNTRKSKHMNKIVKEAIGVLLPTQFHEVVAESENFVDRELHRIREKSREGVIGKLRHLGYAVWREELLHMASVGYRPQNTDIVKAMDYMVESKEDYERNEKYNPDRTFVWIKPNEVLYKVGSDEEARSVPSTDDLPENIRGKMFVLMVSDKNTFIDEVGMKADDNKFWVIL